MKLSSMLLNTLKEDPRDAEVPSHRLMLRAGMIKRLASGIYSYLPYGLKALRRVENIVRDEMNRAGSQEVLLPGVQPAELWKESGRWDLYGKELLRFMDRKGAEFCLGPTHEEVITDLARREVTSYKDLPLVLYQIQTKFRDEIRPRFGIMRAREFIMKDAYSFDRDDASAEKSYEIMFNTYERIFTRCGLDFKAVEADTGSIGGSFSHEFMVLADTGEDMILSCSTCKYAANIEKAESLRPVKMAFVQAPKGRPEKVHTPGVRTVSQVSEFLGVRPENLVKTMVYNTDKGPIAAMVRGDHDVNEAKLRNLLGLAWLELADDETVLKVTGAPVGFAGPVGLEVNVVADFSLLDGGPYVTGANDKDYHLTGVWLGRDARIDTIGDIRFTLTGEPCPKCKKGVLEGIRGIEVGHVFKLGLKYSKAMNAVFTDVDGEVKPMVMGCYGIGIGRTVAAAIEQNHDDAGIVFPVSIAPYPFLVLPVDVKQGPVMDTASRIYEDLCSSGIDVILDDRDERPGVKFKDADLIGVPYRITVGKKSLDKGIVEVKERSTGRVKTIAPDKVTDYLRSVLKRT